MERAVEIFAIVNFVVIGLSHILQPRLAAAADAVVEDVLSAWREPLKALSEQRAYAPAHTSRWGPPYCIDAMLEHAVMHPIRHTHQLRGLLGR